MGWKKNVARRARRGRGREAEGGNGVEEKRRTEDTEGTEEARAGG
jgi:hypothetical protein